MSNLPGISSSRKPKRMAMSAAQEGTLVRGSSIIIKAGQVDAGNTSPGRSTILRPGNVLIKEIGTDEFIVADEFQNAEDGAKAAVPSAQPVDIGWQNMILRLYRDGVLVGTVTGGAADDTAAEWVTLVNADQNMAANVTASDAAGLLLLTDNVGKGALRVEASIFDAYANVFNTTESYSEAITVKPDVRVLLEEVDMLDASGTAGAGFSSDNAWSGHFKTADLVTGGVLGSISLSARGILEARGSQFTA